MVPPRLVLCALAFLLVASGCSGDPDGPGSPAASPEVTLAFAQWLPDEGTDRAMLRVTNESADPLHVTGAGLRWSGYDDFVDPQDDILAPGQTLDLRITLPPARCDAGDQEIVGVVRTQTGEVAEPLTRTGQEFLRHLWLRGCQADLVRRQVSIGYGDDWRIRTVHGEAAAVGSLHMEREGGDQPVAVLGAGGSVLYVVEVARRVVARPSVPHTVLPLRILAANRCDEHARGQATAPFTFRIDLRVGDTTTRMLIPPPPRVQILATEALDRACRRRAAKAER